MSDSNMKITEHNELFGSQKIHYKIYEPQKEAHNLKTVFILQGWLTTLELYNSIALLLGKNYKVICFDFPGFGLSSEPKEYWNVSKWTNWFIEWVNELRIKNIISNSKIILIGHSFGCRVIIKLFGEYLNSGNNNENEKAQLKNTTNNQLFLHSKEQIEKIVIIGGAGVEPKKSIKIKLKILLYKTTKAIINAPLVKSIKPNAIKNFESSIGSDDWKNSTHIMKRSLTNVVNEDLQHLMNKVTPPTLLIWGSDDYSTPLKDGKIMEQKMPNAGLALIQGVGHYTFLEAPVIFSRIIESFLLNNANALEKDKNCI